MVDNSGTITWLDGQWLDGSPSVVGPKSHAFLFCSTVFDGARAFEGVVPDLELHCDRINRSAIALGLAPTMEIGEIVRLALQGVAKFPEGAELYIQPMYWAEEGGPLWISANPDSTKFLLCIFELPMARPVGFSITKSRFVRPTIECMPVDAKAGCLYPNNGRALREANLQGFDNCLLPDFEGNIAELASANVFLVKDGVVMTPKCNGTFLNGITRQRVISLLCEDGFQVEETSLTYEDFLSSDEIFSTGNATKVSPITRIDDVCLPVGPVCSRARELYWSFAHGAANSARF